VCSTDGRPARDGYGGAEGVADEFGLRGFAVPFNLESCRPPFLVWDSQRGTRVTLRDARVSRHLGSCTVTIAPDMRGPRRCYG
jgi:hypothetical protein